MKVLEICAAYKPAYIYGGPTMSVSMLSENLAGAGIETTVYATTANGKTELLVTPGEIVNVDGVMVTYFARITKDHSHFSPSLFKKLWATAPEFDLIHIHAWWNLVSLFSCLIALLRRVPVMVSPRGTLSSYSFQNKNIGIKWFIHHLLGKPLLNKSHIHVTSAREYDAVQKLIKPLSITTLPNFVKLPPNGLKYTRPLSNYLKLIFFSRIEEKKGLDLLLNALPLITCSYHLTIAGTGNEVYVDALKAISAKNKTEDHITWVGFQNEHKFELLATHDLFVLPSYDENFGNAVIESLSVGTPVLITEQVGLSNYVEVNRIGWICKTSAASIAKAIKRICNDQNELERIRETAPGKIYEDFNEHNLVNKYIAMYQQLIDK